MIENADGTPEELERKKQQAIRYRILKRNSNIFIVCSSLIQIVETLIILGVLLIASLFIMFRVFHIENLPNGSMIMQGVFFILFFAGLILGFFAYRKIMIFIIKKFNLEDKLLESTLEHFKSKKS